MPTAPQAPTEYATTGEYMAAEKARLAEGAAPGTPPIYPISPSDVRNRAWRLDVLRARVAPTLPKVAGKPAPFGLTRLGDTKAGLTAEDYLREYPACVNAEYLTPMTQVIDDAMASGDMTGIAEYCERINPEIAKGLAIRAALVEGGDAVTVPAAVATKVEGDPADADGTAAVTVTFGVLSSLGVTIANAPVSVSATNGATVDPASGTTDSMGTLAVSVTSETPGASTVTGTSGAAIGSATVNFTALDSVLTTITGNASVDGNVADGETQNNATFVAADQYGQPMGGIDLALTVDSETAVLHANTDTSAQETGSATVSVVDTVAEKVTVTATSGDVSGTAKLTFVDAS
jgi:hypothetical protein